MKLVPLTMSMSYSMELFPVRFIKSPVNQGMLPSILVRLLSSFSKGLSEFTTFLMSLLAYGR